MKEIAIKTRKRIELVDITTEVEKAVSEAKVKEGSALIFVPHTTAALTINENADPDVKTDILNFLSQLVPEKGNYRHAEGNSDAHIKSSLLGCGKLIPVSQGKLALGTWQGIIFCEFDGPRSRKAFIQVK